MNKKIVLIVLLIFLLVGLVTIYPVLFQEGNPLPIIKGIIKLNSSNSDIIKISDEPKTYITKEDNILIVTRIQYTRKYMIWKIAKMS